MASTSGLRHSGARVVKRPSDGLLLGNFTHTTAIPTATAPVSLDSIVLDLDRVFPPLMCHPSVAVRIREAGYRGRVLESLTMVKQFRFPRSKRRRVQKKWAKRPENFVPSSTVLALPPGFGARAFLPPSPKTEPFSMSIRWSAPVVRSAAFTKISVVT